MGSSGGAGGGAPPGPLVTMPSIIVIVSMKGVGGDELEAGGDGRLCGSPHVPYAKSHDA